MNPYVKTYKFDGTGLWRDFLHRFESCVDANCWSKKTIQAVKLKFCLVGAAGSIVHKNPRSYQWEYERIVEEMEITYGPFLGHAAALHVELRQRVCEGG